MAVRADLQGRLFFRKPVFANDRAGAAVFARSARVGQESVFENLERIFGFDDFGRVVGEIDHNTGAAVNTVPVRTSAPSAEQKLQKDERGTVVSVSPDRDTRVSAHLARGHDVRRSLGERTHDRICESKAGEAAGGDRRRRHGVGDRGGRDAHVNGAEEP